MTKVSASILSADFSILKEEVLALDKTSIDYFHFDIMDNHFVPNLTFGTDVVGSVRKYTDKIFDVHLMVYNPETYFESLKNAGADIITFHIEATHHHDKLLTQIKDMGLKAGIALNPSTPLEGLDYLLEKLDLILIMTVNPGFGGQKFLDSQLKKIKILKSKIKNYNIELAVDGGVNNMTAPKLKEAGANVLVAGSYILNSNNYSNQVQLLKDTY
ncbi:UNVERIFIED_CONTAM: hypothetical protein PYX00_011091 [Menopon gallinae]|uniref:Ribulose-phosphate 3-epimerase n=1 Tax=Menopon gallinae TaxID=328185 RepID=A0AAW2H5V1_9NEOP